MLNLGRRDGSLDTKTAQKLPLGPAPYGATGVATRPGTAARSSSPPAIPMTSPAN